MKKEEEEEEEEEEVVRYIGKNRWFEFRSF